MFSLPRIQILFELTIPRPATTATNKATTTSENNDKNGIMFIMHNVNMFAGCEPFCINGILRGVAPLPRSLVAIARATLF